MYVPVAQPPSNPFNVPNKSVELILALINSFLIYLKIAIFSLSYRPVATKTKSGVFNINSLNSIKRIEYIYQSEKAESLSISAQANRF